MNYIEKYEYLSLFTKLLIHSTQFSKYLKISVFFSKENCKTVFKKKKDFLIDFDDQLQKYINK